MPQTENGIDTEIIAQSCAMAHRAALGLPRVPFDHISDDDEARWQRLAIKAEELMTSLEGQNFEQVAYAVARAFLRVEGVLSLDAKMQVAWGAVARHLAMILDSEEIPGDLQKQEEAWREWAKKRLSTNNCGRN